MKEKTLSEKIHRQYEELDDVLRVEDVKEAISGAEKRLKEEFIICRDKTDIWADEESWNKFERMFKMRINEIWKEVFGENFTK